MLKLKNKGDFRLDLKNIFNIANVISIISCTIISSLIPATCINLSIKLLNRKVVLEDRRKAFEYSILTYVLILLAYVVIRETASYFSIDILVKIVDGIIMAPTNLLIFILFINAVTFCLTILAILLSYLYFIKKIKTRSGSIIFYVVNTILFIMFFDPYKSLLYRFLV